MKFDFDKYKDCKIAIHCGSIAETKDLCREMNEAGLKWIDGTSYLQDSYTPFYGNNTCYCFDEGVCESVRRAKVLGYTILEWSDFMNKNKFAKSDLKNGDVCVLQNGSVYIAIPEIHTLIGGWNELNLDNFTDNLTHINNENKDIADVFRPTKPEHCTFLSDAYTYGDHVYYTDKVKLTKKEIAEKLGIDVDNLEIVE